MWPWHERSLACPPDNRKPRLRPTVLERFWRLWIGFKLRGRDRFDDPTASECLSEFCLGNSPWSPIAWLRVAETHQEQLAVLHRDVSQSSDVGKAIRIGEDVEQPTVDHVVELAI